jgi:hypothetical protein
MDEALKIPLSNERDYSVGRSIVDALRAKYDETFQENAAGVDAIRDGQLEPHRGRAKATRTPAELVFTGVVLGELSMLSKAIGIAEAVLAQSGENTVLEDVLLP